MGRLVSCSAFVLVAMTLAGCPESPSARHVRLKKEKAATEAAANPNAAAADKPFTPSAATTDPLPAELQGQWIISSLKTQEHRKKRLSPELEALTRSASGGSTIIGDTRIKENTISIAMTIQDSTGKMTPTPVVDINPAKWTRNKSGDVAIEHQATITYRDHNDNPQESESFRQYYVLHLETDELWLYTSATPNLDPDAMPLVLQRR